MLDFPGIILEAFTRYAYTSKFVAIDTDFTSTNVERVDAARPDCAIVDV